MALKKKRAMCKKSCGSGVDAVEEVRLGEDDGGRQKQEDPLRERVLWHQLTALSKAA
jgi:hypothetical protein